MAERDRLQSVIRKSQRYGFLPGNFQSARDTVEFLESNLFRSAVRANPQHVLFCLLPPVKANDYNLRQRSHHLTLPQIGNNFIREKFLYRMLFKDNVHSLSCLFVLLFTHVCYSLVYINFMHVTILSTVMFCICQLLLMKLLTYLLNQTVL